MRTKFKWALPLLLVVTLNSAAQKAPSARSHVERFSTPEARSIKLEAETTEALLSKGDDPVLLNTRGLARLRLKNFDGASEDLKKALGKDPANAGYWANYGYALWKLGRGAEAIEVERKALSIDPKNYTANYQLGRFLLRAGDPASIAESARLLKNALEIDPRQYEVRFELIAVLRELKDTASALAQLEILEDARPTDPRVKYVTGLLYLDRNNFELAIENLEAALETDPTMYGAWQDLGLAYVRQDKWNSAILAFSELAGRQQNSVEAAYLHALALYNAKRTLEAEREVRRALRVNSGFAEARTLLGIILVSRGDSLPEALDSLTQAVALDPENFDAVFYLGRVNYQVGNYAASEAALSRAVTLKPDSLEARFYLGSVFEKIGEPLKAQIQYGEIVKLDSTSFFGKIGLGAINVKDGKLVEAIAILKAASELKPENFEANWALGRALILAKDFTSAESVLRKAVSLEPGRTDARYQLGIALRRQGKNEEAKKEFALVDKINKEFRQGGGDQER